MNAIEMLEEIEEYAERMDDGELIVPEEDIKTLINKIKEIDKLSSSSARLIERRSCDKCKWAEWVGQGGMGMVCNKHGNEIEKMFPNDEPIDRIGCLQFEPQEPIQ
jgi:hypothetical protein